MISISTKVTGQLSIIIQNENGEALPYVGVYTADFTFTGESDTNGELIIPDDVSDESVFVFKFLGYNELKKTKSELIANSIVTMTPGLLLDEVLLVGRADNRSDDLPGTVRSIDAKVFQLTNPQTSADALAQHADVYVQKSQMGGGSPVVRGFEANKVLLVLDGVRMNNAIYRSGHLQNAITVDNAVLDKLEVLYGPGSLIYGSDAIGGVVHFRTKNPKLNFDKTKKLTISGNGSARYATANNEKSTHIDFQIGGRKLASLTSFSFSDFEDLRTGSKRSDKYPDFGKRLIFADRLNGQDIIRQNPNPNLQIGTGYQQFDVLQKVLYQHNKNWKTIANFQYSTSSDIPRYDALIEPDGGGLQNAEWYYGPQKRIFSSLRNDVNLNGLLSEKIIFIASYQRIDEDRIDRRFGSVNRDRQEENVHVLSLTADMYKYLSSDESTKLSYGLEFTKNWLYSEAFRTDINSGMVSNNIFTRYPSGSSDTRNLGAYALLNKSFAKLDLFAGLRGNLSSLNVRYDRSDNLPWPDDYYDGVNNQNNSISWSVGARSKMISGWKFQSQFGTAFRSPNIDDLAKMRVNVDEISVPNLDLKPETSLNGELTISKKLSSVTLSATGFVTKLDNAIVRETFTLPDGSQYLVDEGDSLRIVANVNAEDALVKGVSININAAINPKWTIKGSASYIRGESTDAEGVKTPLSHIPPLYGDLDVSYKSTKNNINFVMRFNGEKPLDQYGGSEDNLENATPDGTPAWYTFNIYFKRDVGNGLSFTTGLENIMDVHYRTFASGVSAPGRNLIISLNKSF